MKNWFLKEGDWGNKRSLEVDRKGGSAKTNGKNQQKDLGGNFKGKVTKKSNGPETKPRKKGGGCKSRGANDVGTVGEDKKNKWGVLKTWLLRRINLK